MRTEDALRSTLQELADRAPTEISLDRTAGRIRSRPVVAAITIAAAVAVVAVGIPLLTRGGSGRPGSAPNHRAVVSDPGFQCDSRLRPPTGDALRFDIGFSSLKGFSPLQLQWSCSAASGGVMNYAVPRAPGATNVSAQFNAFRAGRFDPTKVRRGDPITVDGHRAFYYRYAVGSKSGDEQPSSAPTGKAPVPTPTPAVQRGRRTAHVHEQHSGVAWEYAPRSWAVLDNQAFVAVIDGKVIGPQAPRRILTRMAGAIHPGTGAALLVPFRLGYLPSGLTPAVGASQLLLPGPFLPGSGPGEYNGGTIGFTIPARSTGVGLPLSVVVAPGSIPAGVRFEINARPAVFSEVGPDTVQLSVGYTDERLEVNTTRDSGISRGEMIKIARHATVLGTIRSKAGWIDAEQALPH